MAEDNVTREANVTRLVRPMPADDNDPRMVTIFRGFKEIAAVDASDAKEAVRQLCILVLKLDGGLLIGDLIQVTRIDWPRLSGP